MSTPSRREQILATLHRALNSGGRIVPRNAPISDFEGQFLSLRDGKTEQTEAFLNPPIYEFTLMPQLVILVESELPETGGATDSRDTALDALIEAVSQAFEAIVDWPDFVIDSRMLPPDFDTHEILGAAGMKGCEIPIEIDYWSDSERG